MRLSLQSENEFMMNTIVKCHLTLAIFRQEVTIFVKYGLGFGYLPLLLKKRKTPSNLSFLKDKYTHRCIKKNQLDK